LRADEPGDPRLGDPRLGDPRLGDLVARVRSTPRYANVCETAVRRIGARELAVHPSFREAVKATQRRLHQAGGAYLADRIRYAEWLERLQAAHSDGPDAFRGTCREMMRLHASTRERLPILERLYRESLADVAPVSSVIDVACGLGPLAIPWMPLAEGARYAACDIYEDLIGFLSAFLPLAGVTGHAEVCDVLVDPPAQPAQVALVQKTLPILEQQAGGASLALLDRLPCEHILVTYPAASLGGRAKGMPAQYTESFERLAVARNWRVRRYSYPQELAFLVSKGEPVGRG